MFALFLTLLISVKKCLKILSNICDLLILYQLYHYFNHYFLPNLSSFTKKRYCILVEFAVFKLLWFWPNVYGQFSVSLLFSNLKYNLVLFVHYFNTQNMTNSTLVSSVKMEYGWNFSISKKFESVKTTAMYLDGKWKARPNLQCFSRPKVFIGTFETFSWFSLYPSTLNNSNETHTFMCLGRAGRFGQH